MRRLEKKNKGLSEVKAIMEKTGTDISDWLYRSEETMRRINNAVPNGLQYQLEQSIDNLNQVLEIIKPKSEHN